MQQISFVMGWLLSCAALCVWAQPGNRPDVIAQLLALPAPRPTNPHQPPPPSLAGFDERRQPPADAPLAVLEAYWSVGGPHPDKSQMPAAVRERFLALGEQQRDKLPYVLEQELVPDTPATHARVKAILDMGLVSFYGETNPARLKQYEEKWQQQLRDWLLLHSPYYLDELAQKARTVREEEGEVADARYLQALAQLNWERAQPLLDSYRFSPQPRVAALAVSLLYDHAVTSQSDEAATLRARLQQIVSDSTLAGKARELACTTLMKTNWDGRDEWFLSLFADDSLRVMEDGRSGLLYPLNGPVLKDPEHWVPLLAKLVGHTNRAIHEAAVDCLASFDPAAPRKEALLPLLPWLANPTWSAAAGRKELIQSLAKVSVPEAVPGLIWIVANEEDAELAVYAAEALATYRNRSAAPALRRFLTRPLGPSERTVAIEALIACDGLSEDEMARAVEAYATKAAALGQDKLEDKPERLAALDFDDNVPLQIHIGKVLSEAAAPREEVARRLLDRLTRLTATQPATARVLWQLVRQWDLRVVDEVLLQRLATNQSDVKEWEFALDNREPLRRTVPDRLATLALQPTAVAGLAAVLLNEENLLYKILHDEAREPKRALLAAARLTRTPLPLASVSALLSDTALQAVAEQYLESDDSAEARRLLWAKHPGEALILGAREDFPPKPPPSELLKWEEKLRTEVLATNGADEIIALLAPKSYLNPNPSSRLFATWQTQNHLILRVRQGQAELAWYKDEGRYEYRVLTATELRELRTFLAERDIENLPPHITNPGAGQTAYEFLRLTKAGGRRLYLVNPEKSVVDGDPCLALLQQFRRLTEGHEFRARYDLQARLPQMEVLYANSEAPITSICNASDKLTVFMDYSSNLPLRPEEIRAMTVRTGWYEFVNGKPGNKVDAPRSCGMPSLAATYYDARGRAITVYSGIPNYQFARYMTITSPQPGIGRFPDLRDNLIVRGDYQDVRESLDEKWLLAVKGGRTGPKSLVRIELATRQEFPINFSITGPVGLLRFLRPQNQFLVVHQPAPGKAEAVLIDPTSGVVAPVPEGGDTRPLPPYHQRELQPTAQPDEAWAVLHNQATQTTAVGRFHLRNFTFTPVATIPELRFSAGEMWVDEAARAIYVAYRGHLLRFPY